MLRSYLVSSSPLLEDVLERDSWEDSGSLGTRMQLASSNWICAAGEHPCQLKMHRTDVLPTTMDKAAACFNEVPCFRKQ